MVLLSQLQSLKNRLDFRLRNLLAWEVNLSHPADGGGDWFSPNDDCPMKRLFPDDPEAAEIAQGLWDYYGSFLAAERIPRQAIPELLTYLHWLDRMAAQHPESFQNLPTNAPLLRWLDVGAKNWAYAPALYAFIRKHYGEDFRLDGIEIDPNRRYADFRTRGQAARQAIEALPQVFYHQGDVRTWREPATVISHFLPFVFPEPHLAWGLPLTYFDPEAVLDGLLEQLSPGGLLILVNQGEVEAERQEALLRNAGSHRPFRYENLGQLPSPFIQYRYPRFGWLCIAE